MADKFSIEWTDATWNPVTGCTKISAGCDFCYAERFSERFRGTPGHPFESGFDLTLRPERLEQPLAWRRQRMIFVNSMSDLFHKDVPKEFIGRVFDTIEIARWHTFQVLTKRSSLMRNFLRSRYGARPARRTSGAACRLRMEPSFRVCGTCRKRRQGWALFPSSL
jgi:protein gp37